MPAFNFDMDENNEQQLQHVPSNSPAPPMPRQLDDRSFQRQLLADIDTFIFDADGWFFWGIYICILIMLKT
jgi:hypothetical protein